MSGQQAIGLIDRLLAQAQQRKLNDLESTIVLQTWEGITYKLIADQVAYNFDYIKQIAARLWKLLSKLLNESICKSNLKSVLTRYQISTPTAEWSKPLDLLTLDEIVTDLQTLETLLISDSLEERLYQRMTTIAFFSSGKTTKPQRSLKLDRQIQGDIKSLIWQSLHEQVVPNILVDKILSALRLGDAVENSVNCLIVNCYF